MKLNKGRVLIVVLWLAGLLIMGAAVLFWEARPQTAVKKPPDVQAAFYVLIFLMPVQSNGLPGLP